MKKRISTKEEPTVQIFSVLTNMKFQPKSLKATQELHHKLQKQQQKSSRQTSLISYLGKRLTFVIQIMQHHFLVGNQNQVDFISVGGLVNQFVDVQYFWSIHIKGPIELIELDPKKTLIVIYSLKKLHIFAFNNKKKHQQPKVIITEQLNDEVKFMRFPKQQFLALFYSKHFQVYNFNQSHSQMTKSTVKKYPIKQNFVLLDVPTSTQNFLNLFFEEPKKNQSFGLWCFNITFDLIKIRIGAIYKIYDIMKKFKKVLEIINYSKQIVFINLGSQVIAAKKGFIIDSVNVNIKSQNTSLRYVGFQKLLHITNKRIEVYSFKVNTATVPNRINLKAIDSLQLGDVPSISVFLGASINKDSNITVFFQNQGTVYTNGEIQYWFKTSYSIDRESKVKKIFNYGKQISTIDHQILSNKYDIAQKMGLSQRDIYLEIWNRSSKSSVQDYNFLLATNHYKTIRTEIQNKLRKHTMSFRELVKIQKSCYEMLQKKVYSPHQKCNQQNLQDFLTSHYYQKKLNLFMEINLLKQSDQKKTSHDQNNNPQSQHVMTIDIQQYSTYKQFELKQFILDQVNEFCFRNKTHMAEQIRHTFKQFRFVIRMFYKELLKDIIHVSKGSITKLLIAIPQILPFRHILMKQQNPLMYQGIWTEISNNQWIENLYLDNIITIENKEMIEQFIETIWFKRNYRIYHILVPKKKEEIIQTNRILNSDVIFYFFLSQIFHDHLKGGNFDYTSIAEIVNYLENHFQLFPEHLKSNVFLYYELYQYYMSQQQWKLPKMNLEKFFTLKDYQLFRYFFDLQKIKKNCILKQIKPIYKKLHIHGNQIFNQGLLSYFDSQVSELSDLKYILNRINNEKAEFHEQNLSMYEILLKAMEMKIKLGTGEDAQASISEVLVYVENIPTALLLNEQNKKFHDELKTIKNIQKHQKTLQKMNLNMTIQYMLKRCQDVILKMVDFQIEDKQLFRIKDYEIFKQKSLQILDEIKNIKDNIYGDVYPNLAIFAFSTTVLQKQDLILFLAKLFNEPTIKKLFTFDQNFIENIVIYAYKWKFSQNSIFIYNQNYVKKLFEFLSPQNNTRKFLESQLRLALIFSQAGQNLQYPISINYVVPKAFQIQQIVSFLSKQYIAQIDFQEVCNLLNTMHSISKNTSGKERPFITLQKVYEIFIERLLKQPHSSNQCFDILKKYLVVKKSRPPQQDQYQSLDQFPAYISIFYAQVYTELNQESKQKLTELLGLLYKQPQTLLQIFEHLLSQKRTGLQTIEYLTKILNKVYQRDLLCFDPQNTLLQFRLVNEARIQNSKVPHSVLNKIVRNSLQNMKVQKDAFKQNEIYNILFYNICHSPLNCLTILRFYKQKIKYKQFRNYISHLTQQIIFNQNELIQCFVILFALLLKNFKYNEQFEAILLNHYFNTPETKKNHFQIFKEHHEIQVFQTPQEDYYKKLLKSLKRFLRKRTALSSVRRSRRKNVNRAQQIQLLFEHEKNIDTTKRSRAKRNQNPYPFSDSDFAQDDELNPTPPQVLRRRRKYMKIDFDCQNERLKMLKRNDEDLTEYLATNCELTVMAIGIFSPEDNFSDKSSIGDHSPGGHKFKLTERKKSVEQQKLKEVHEEQKIKYKVNRSLGIQSVPAEYITSHNKSFIEPQSAKRKTFKSFEDDKDDDSQHFLKRQSYHEPQNLHKHSSKSSNQKDKDCMNIPSIQSVKSGLLKSSHQSDVNSIRIFDIKSLGKIKQECFFEQDQKFSQYLKELLKSIFQTKGFNDGDKLNLINQIVKKYPTVTKFCNKKILQIYLRFSTLKKSYEVEIDTTQIFGFNGILTQSSQGSNIYPLYHEKVLQLMNDDNAVKVSRLIALTLRKNYLQQQIIYSYLVKKLKQIGLSNRSNLQQKEELLLRKIIFSMTIKRFVDNFDDIMGVMKQYSQKNELVRQTYRKVTQIILQSIQTKGDYRTQQDLRARANVSINQRKNSDIQLKLTTTDSNK